MTDLFCERLKSLRKSAGITQQELADGLGVHFQTVSKWERGVSMPDFALLGEIAQKLGVSLEKLLGQSEEECYTGSYDMSAFGKAVAAARKGSGESQDELASALNVTGDVVSKWERGVVCPDAEQLCAIARHFSQPASKLYYAVPSAYTPKLIAKRNVKTVTWAVALTALLVAALCLAVFLGLAEGTYDVTVDGKVYAVSASDWFSPTPAEKTGYVFSHYIDKKGKRVDFPLKVRSDTEFFAVYVPTEYKLDYWLNGGIMQNASYSFTMESGVVQLPVPTKRNAQFLGWYLTPDYSGEAVTSVTCQGNDVSLYARWSDNQCSVRYVLNGGMLIENNPETVTDYEVALNVPVRSGYVFLGWYDSPEGGDRYEKIGGGNSNLTLYALWQQEGGTFGISYETDGGSVSGNNPSEVLAGDVHLLAPAQKHGYDFVGWNTSADGSGKYVEVLYGVQQDTVLYAVFTPKIYTVVYHLEDGSYYGAEVNPNKVTYGDVVELLPLRKAGHVFKGWTDVHGNEVTQIDSGNVEGITALYARFEAVLYTVTLDGNGGTFLLEDRQMGYAELKIAFGETLTLPQCTFLGSVFLGWQDETGSFVQQVDVTNVGNMLLTAAYVEADRLFTVTLQTEGGEMDSPNVIRAAYGQNVPLPEPEKNGYLFLGWNTSSDGSGEYFSAIDGISDDVVLYAVWQEIKVVGDEKDFSYQAGAESATITGYHGAFGAEVDLVIPDFVGGKPVVALGENFFTGLSERGEVVFNSIVIPSSVTHIGEKAFCQITVNQPLVIPASVQTIGEMAFWYCKLEIKFQGTIKEIPQMAFQGTKLLGNFVLPEGVQRICRHAFNNAIISGGGIILPQSLKYVETSAFHNASFAVYLPEGVFVERYAFGENCTVYVSEQQVASYPDEWCLGNVIYLTDDAGVTLVDDEQTFVSDKAFYLPKPYKQGYLFCGWQNEQGNLHNGFYVAQQTEVLTAVYAKQTSDGQSVSADVSKTFAVKCDESSGSVSFTLDLPDMQTYTLSVSVATCGAKVKVISDYYYEIEDGVVYTHRGETFRADVSCPVWGTTVVFTITVTLV